mmetsp:Transcript_3266/g.7782  ORF Transcript_3266/g.7782 Transcript_3266/m.7782 type:complete len:348 (-) Transcript_3266:804-1847(-)
MFRLMPSAKSFASRRQMSRLIAAPPTLYMSRQALPCSTSSPRRSASSTIADSKGACKAVRRPRPLSGITKRYKARSTSCHGREHRRPNSSAQSGSIVSRPASSVVSDVSTHKRTMSSLPMTGRTAAMASWILGSHATPSRDRHHFKIASSAGHTPTPPPLRSKLRCICSAKTRAAGTRVWRRPKHHNTSNCRSTFKRPSVNSREAAVAIRCHTRDEHAAALQAKARAAKLSGSAASGKSSNPSSGTDSCCEFAIFARAHIIIEDDATFPETGVWGARIAFTNSVPCCDATTAQHHASLAVSSEYSDSGTKRRIASKRESTAPEASGGRGPKRQTDQSTVLAKRAVRK